jgi:hypothetical protein
MSHKRRICSTRIGQTHTDISGTIIGQTHIDILGAMIGQTQRNLAKRHLRESSGTCAEEGVSKHRTGKAGFNSATHYNGIQPLSAFAHCHRERVCNVSLTLEACAALQRFGQDAVRPQALGTNAMVPNERKRPDLWAVHGVARSGSGERVAPHRLRFGLAESAWKVRGSGG